MLQYDLDGTGTRLILTIPHLGLEHDAGLAESRHVPVLLRAGDAAPRVARLAPAQTLVTCREAVC